MECLEECFQVFEYSYVIFITESSLLPLWLGKHFMIQLLNIFKDLYYDRGLVFLGHVPRRAC